MRLDRAKPYAVGHSAVHCQGYNDAQNNDYESCRYSPLPLGPLHKVQGLSCISHLLLATILHYHLLALAMMSVPMEWKENNFSTFKRYALACHGRVLFKQTSIEVQ